MAISVSNWVWDHSKSRHGARLVLLAIADCVKTEGGWAWPSVKELCRKTQLAERAVRAAITELSGLGEIDVEFNAGPGGCNRYRVVSAGTTPAKNAGVQSLQVADSAGVHNSHPPVSVQLNGQTPAESAPPAENAPLQKTTLTPAESAPGTVKNRKRSSSKKNVGENEPPREDVERTCAHLADRIVAHGSKKPTITDEWRTAARLLLDKDERTEEQVHTAIDWCQDSEFWHSNIMSMPALRKQYDRLRLQAQKEQRERDRAPAIRQTSFSDEEYTSGW